MAEVCRATLTVYSDPKSSGTGERSSSRRDASTGRREERSALAAGTGAATKP
jgi:hypothetical protein